MIIDIINELRATTKTNEKLAILEQNKDNETFKQVLYYTYNPRFKYGIEMVPQYNSKTGDMPIEEVFDKLDKFAHRQVTGNRAIIDLSELLSNSKEPEVLECIIDRDLKAGVNVSLINRVFGKLIPEEPYQGCLSFNKKLALELFENDNVIAQIKADGQYVNAIILDYKVELKSRAGEVQYLNGRFVQELHKFVMKNIVLNGEVVIPGIERSVANGIIRSVISLNEKKEKGTLTTKEIQKFEKTYGDSIEYFENLMEYIVWDAMPYGDYVYGYCDAEYRYRLDVAAELIGQSTKIKLIEGKEVETYNEAMDYFKDALDRGEEGVVIKSLSSEWKDGKFKHQLKLKIVIDLDLEICSFKEGRKKTKYEGTLGSLVVKSSDGLLISGISGLKEKDGLREEIWNNQDLYLGKIITVKCNGISKNKHGGYGLLYGNFVTVRDDKLEAQSLASCLEAQEMALGLTNG